MIVFSAALLGAALVSAPALAGPRMTFGPDDQGALQIDYKGQFQLNVRDTGSGGDGNGSTTSLNFRRNRIALMGRYGEKASIYVQTEYLEDSSLAPLQVRDGSGESNFEILDAVLRLKFDEAFRVNVGKYKNSFLRENLEACENPLTLDRSLFLRPPFAGTRDRGVGIWGNVADGRFQYRLDVSEGRESAGNRAVPASSPRFDARIHASLLEPEADYGYKGTYLGKKKVLTVGAAVQHESKVAWADTAGKNGEADYTGKTVDLFLEYPTPSAGTVTLSGAWADVDLDDLYRGAAPDPEALGVTGQRNGWYVKAGYLLPGVPLQLFGRVESWRFASLNNDPNNLPSETVYDQEVRWTGLGANWYVPGVLDPENPQALKLSFEWSRTDFDRENATSRDFNAYVTQLQVVF
jgi:hypothetical protein